MLRTSRLCLYISGNQFNIEYHHTREVIGEVSYHYEAGEYQLSFSVLPSARGRGFATEAMKEIRRYLFLECHAARISMKIDAENSEGIRVAEKLGMKKNAGKKKIYFELKRNDYLASVDKMKLYSSDGKTLDFTVYRGEPFPKDVKYGVVDILVHNTVTDCYLVTRRDINKETYPGYYEITGGAVCYQETEEEAARREVFEETGITLDSIQKISESQNKKAFYFAFYGECSCALDSVVLQKDETIEYRWMKGPDFLKFFREGKMVKRQKTRYEKLFLLVK